MAAFKLKVPWGRNEMELVGAFCIRLKYCEYLLLKNRT
jgi:hypothetical protein